jgi:hypothetical protein
MKNQNPRLGSGGNCLTRILSLSTLVSRIQAAAFDPADADV